MFSLNDSMRYMLYIQPTDMRKSYHSLSGMVSNSMGCDPGNHYICIGTNNVSFNVIENLGHTGCIVH